MSDLILSSADVAPADRRYFAELLPAVTAQVRRAFRRLTPELREDAMQAAVGDAYAAYVRLCRMGRRSLAYATPLARYAVRRFHAGRRLGCRLNTFDVLSPYRRRGHECCVHSLEGGDDGDGRWQAVVVEDRRSGPAETAAVRLDFAEWLRQLSPRRRRVARLLAGGEATASAARLLAVTPGRISQYRRELEAAWRAYQGEGVGLSAAC